MDGPRPATREVTVLVSSTAPTEDTRLEPSSDVQRGQAHFEAASNTRALSEPPAAADTGRTCAEWHDEGCGVPAGAACSRACCARRSAGSSPWWSRPRGT